jgi:ornithine cyclodeaminase/alanine dehydrogenase
LDAGTLGITLDYDCYWSDEALTRADRVFTDDVAQMQHIKEHGYFVGCPAPAGDLGAVAGGMCSGRDSPEQTIIAANLGVAVEDVAVATALYEAARARRIGIELSH